jgi:hypothetical protein
LASFVEQAGPAPWRSPVCCFCVSKRHFRCFSGTGEYPGTVGPDLSSTSAFHSYSLPVEQAHFSVYGEQKPSQTNVLGDDVDFH